mmetsp:Transcript_2255/g.3037  ORF Transcript_2255/g.3037 Transcript_2255/m.3037 type:complete len:482 (+) Transcript_2255:248-1693(+)
MMIFLIHHCLVAFYLVATANAFSVPSLRNQIRSSGFSTANSATEFVTEVNQKLNGTIDSLVQPDSSFETPLAAEKILKLEVENFKLQEKVGLYERQKKAIDLIGTPLLIKNKYLAADNVLLAAALGTFGALGFSFSAIKQATSVGLTSSPAVENGPPVQTLVFTALALGPLVASAVAKFVNSIPDMSSIEGMYGNRQRMMMKLNHRVETFWMNLGYHPGEFKQGLERTTYADAAANLARKLASSADLQPSDKLVDVGFGYGDQDFLFQSEFGVKDITGFNLCMKNVDIAGQRAKLKGLDDIIDFRYGDAVNLPVESGSADKVFSLESAFHYETREDFFGEAFRVLKPGGTLALADYIPKPGVEVPDYAIPPCIPAFNLYDIEEYTIRLERAGFTDIKVEDITKDVWMWPNDKWPEVSQRKQEGLFDGWFYVQYPLQPLEDALDIQESFVNSEIGVGFKLLFVYFYYSNYYIITAKKPEESY